VLSCVIGGMTDFTFEKAEPAERPVSKKFFVELLGNFLHGESVVAGGVERTDDRAGAGTDHVIRHDTLRFEHLDDADMGKAARCTAAESKADFRLVERKLRRFGLFRWQA
jgi:hypothetical protein